MALNWRMMLDIQTTACKSGGFIFGGFVRDFVIHEHYAKKFYDAMPVDLEARVAWKYEDASVHPESWPHRTHMPVDIDVLLASGDVPRFLDGLAKGGYSVTTRYMGTFRKYMGTGINNTAVREMKHQKIEIRLKHHRIAARYLRSPTIMVDIVHHDNILPISQFNFMLNTDFECNALMISPENNLMLPISSAGEGPFWEGSSLQNHSMHTFTQLQQVVNDCINFRAVAVKPSHVRMNKMMMKDFAIITPVSSLVPRTTATLNFKDAGSSEICIICHEDLEGNEYVKNNCCSARYHPKCFYASTTNSIRYNNVKYCMVCRKDIRFGTCCPSHESFVDVCRTMPGIYAAPQAERQEERQAEPMVLADHVDPVDDGPDAAEVLQWLMAPIVPVALVDGAAEPVDAVDAVVFVDVVGAAPHLRHNPSISVDGPEASEADMSSEEVDSY